MLLAGFALSCSKKAEEKKASPSKVENPVKESELTTVKLTDQAVERLGIKTVEIEQKSVSNSRTYSGEVIAVPGQSIALLAPVTGTVLAPANGILPMPGSIVRKGQLLYRLLILPSEKDLLGAQEDASLKKVQYEVSKEKLKRAEQMLKDKSGSLRAKQEAEAEFANITAALRVAEARVELMKGKTGAEVSDKLSTLNVESSIDGIVQKVYVGTSQVVTANAPVIDVASVSPVWIRVPVYAGDLGSINTSGSATARDLSDINGASGVSAKPVNGPRTADPLTTSADVFYELPNLEGKFRPGQKISITVSLKSAKSSLVIPFSAIVYDIQGGTWVYENPSPTVFVRKRVEIENTENNLAILSRGPAAGTKVVIEGVAELFGVEFGGAK
ncbi:MexE family multidrug efflux RND transporter periplasmic adaptor subunit [Cytophagales bacterium WSM2-2]|nr:MexE family multidrug efflux RND transporter periplasmic adaptor subunit [Cytophagales bacterium WSM2-2]